VVGQWQTAALSGAGGVARQSSLDLELQGSVFYAVCIHAKLRSMQTRLGYLEEGSGDLGGARRKGATLGGRFAGDSRRYTISGSIALFGAWPGSTRGGERDELTQGLREVARVAAEGLHGWRWTAVAGLMADELMRGVRHMGAHEGHSHLTAEPRVTKRATGRQRRGRSRRQPKVEDDGGAPTRLGRWRGRAVLVQREATGERLATERERGRANRESERVNPPMAWPTMARRRWLIGDGVCMRMERVQGVHGCGKEEKGRGRSSALALQKGEGRGSGGWEGTSH
jgi:hypothetical protein